MTPITNHDRATWAAAGLLAYCEAKEGAYEPYDEAEYILSDLLTDLMHYAAREGIDFMRCMERAEIHLAAEQQEEAASRPAEPDRSAAAEPSPLTPPSTSATSQTQAGESQSKAGKG